MSAAIVVVALCLTCGAQLREPFVEFATTQTHGEASVVIDAAHPSPFVIPPTIFGTFTENIWDAVYGGVWAQVLHNPSFEPDYLSVQNTLDAARYGRLVTDPSFGSGYVRVEPLTESPTGAERERFLRSSTLGLPLPWEPLRPAGVRYEPRDGDAANSARSLLVMGLPAREVGVRQGVYLPVHRTLRYTGSLWTKFVALDPRPIGGRVPIVTISLRRRDAPNDLIVATTLHVEESLLRPSPTPAAAFARWDKREFVLQVPAGRIASLEKIDFCISVDDERRVLIDDVRLFPADQLEGFDPEVIQRAREMRTSLLRFGGNFASGYHWQDGVGDQDKRRTLLNQAWGLPEYNHFGTDEFLRLCRLIGAEPQISVNAGSGTPEEAAAWLEYCNGSPQTKYGRLRARNGHRAPYHVKFWEIGNELWGDFQIGWQTPAGNARGYGEFLTAMRRADPSVRFIATGADIDFYGEWNGALAAQRTAPLDLVSTHLVIGMQPGEQLTPNPSPEFTHRADFAVPVAVGRKLDEMHAQLQRNSLNSRPALAFTEWQFWSPRPEDPRFTNLGGAINVAAFFHMLVRRADRVPVSNMSNLVQFGGIHRQRGVTFVTPSYHAFKLYSDMVGAHVLPLRLAAGAYHVRGGNRRAPDVPEVSYVDALALLSSDAGTLRLYLVNRALDREIATHVEVAGFIHAEQARVHTLAAAQIAAANTPEAPRDVEVRTRVAPAGDTLRRISLPPHSLTLVEITRRRSRL
ncbi:MAG: alpha-L-arabinofuranosidase C-terminal domain-containing protein [Pyrinomonadaceae bacterium]